LKLILTGNRNFVSVGLPNAADGQHPLSRKEVIHIDPIAVAPELEVPCHREAIEGDELSFTDGDIHCLKLCLV
jgi:hypothetical protein